MAIYSITDLQLAPDPDGISVQFTITKDGVAMLSHSSLVAGHKKPDDIISAIRRLALGLIQDDIYEAIIFPQVESYFAGREWDIA